MPSPPAAGTSNAAAADASTVATVPPPNPFPPGPPPPFSPDALAPLQSRLNHPAHLVACLLSHGLSHAARPVPSRYQSYLLPPLPTGAWREWGVERGDQGRAAKPAHTPPRPPPPNCACCLCIRGAVCVVLLACVRACPFSNHSHPLPPHALPFRVYLRQPRSCCPVLQYLSWRPSGRRVERCKHFRGPRQRMQ